MGGQQSSLPILIIWLQALAVPLLGGLAAWIAYQQWRTADRKVQVDLFDRRLIVYNAIRESLYPIIRNGKALMSDINAYNEATDRAEFLFGEDVTEYLDKARSDISELFNYSANMGNNPPYKKEDIDGKQSSFLKIVNFYQIMPLFLEPYMRLDHKVRGSSKALRELRAERKK